MRIPRPKSKLGILAAAAAALTVVLLGSAGYYKARGEKVCEGCHEIRPSVATWRASSHRAEACTGCHDDAVTASPSVHLANLAGLVTHLRGAAPERLLVTDAVLDRTIARCRSCHGTEGADWAAGPHGKTYTTFFFNEARNRDELLLDDCLRCHGSHFQGGIDDLIRPIDRKGPWRFVRLDMASRPAMPCTSCHWLHGPGEAGRGLAPAAAGLPPDGVPAREEVHRSTLAFFDRRAMRHVPIDDLRVPEIRDGGRKVATSTDPRQALCTQCHGPDATGGLGTGTDRTPAGVHEGMSCLACHALHAMKTRASCANCHPRLSNCGIDVAIMDTTFRSRASKHDIHTVKCADCHPSGVPEKKKR